MIDRGPQVLRLHLLTRHTLNIDSLIDMQIYENGDLLTLTAALTSDHLTFANEGQLTFVTRMIAGIVLGTSAACYVYLIAVLLD